MRLKVLDVLCVSTYIAKKLSCEAAIVSAELNRYFNFSPYCNYDFARKNSVVRKKSFDVAVVQLVNSGIITIDVQDGKRVLKRRGL